jgi:hypothetical protein
MNHTEIGTFTTQRTSDQTEDETRRDHPEVDDRDA